jgi:hypothetical protein
MEMTTTCPECAKPVEAFAVCVRLATRAILYHVSCHKKASERALRLVLEVEEEEKLTANSQQLIALP